MEISKFRLSAGIILVIDIVFLLVILVSLWTTKKIQHNCEIICLPGETKPQICDCRAKIFHKYLNKKFVQEFDKSTADLQKMDLENPFALTSDIIPIMRPKARIGGVEEKSIDDISTNKRLLPLKHWRADGNNMYLNNGMAIRNGRLKVPIRGLYHVYSYIDMRVEIEYLKEIKTNTSIRQAIFKSNIKNVGKKWEEEELIESFNPFGKSNSFTSDKYSIYLSADVFLEAGDEVYVKVCKKEYIKFPRENYFGIHLL